MNRRRLLQTGFAVGEACLLAGRGRAQEVGATICLNLATGADTNPGSEQVISALVPAEFRNVVKQFNAHDLNLRRYCCLWILLPVLLRLGYSGPVF
jgi:hypothetical protein